MLRLKMSVAMVKRVANQGGEVSSEEIEFGAVYGKDGSANAQWSKWTPCARLTMTINNPDAMGRVLPGQFVYVDISPTTEDAI